MNIKKLIRSIHLVLGLISGIIVFIVAVTGCLYVFKSEIESLTQPYRQVEPRQQDFLPPSGLRSVARDIYPEKDMHGIAYGKHGDAAEIAFYSSDPLFYRGVFLDPYTGEILKVKNYLKDFFYVTFIGHYQLWLPRNIGQPIVAISVLVFVVMLMTGIILWWPKRGAARQSFRIKWQAPWKRRFFDLHSVLGFYANLVLLVIALTGLVWGFKWFGTFMYKATGGEKQTAFEVPVSDTTRQVTDTNDFDKVDWLWYQMQREYPNAAHTEVHFPHDEKEALYAHVSPDSDTYWKTDFRYYDQHTLEEIEMEDNIWGKLEDASTADIIRRMNYDIHIGAIGGLPGKIIAFFASLIAASLPITGFLMWRRRKKQTGTSLLNDLNTEDHENSN